MTKRVLSTAQKAAARRVARRILQYRPVMPAQRSHVSLALAHECHIQALRIYEVWLLCSLQCKLHPLTQHGLSERACRGVLCRRGPGANNVHRCGTGVT